MSSTDRNHIIVWLIIILSVISYNIFGQTKMNGYISYPNSATLIPDSVIYTASPHSKVAKRLAEFHGTPNLLRDYAHSGYDIGHNADAEDMDYSMQSEYDSFNFINTYPQRPNCNRITWLALENYVRGLNNPVVVKMSWKGVSGHIGKDNVTVPLYCVKTLHYNGIAETFIIPNQDTCIRHLFTYYKVK